MDLQYAHWVTRAAVVATTVALLLFIIKAFAWWYTGSVSLLAELVDSLVDLVGGFTGGYQRVTGEPACRALCAPTR